MKTRIQLSIAAALWIVSSQFVVAVSSTPDEMAKARRWVAAKFEGAEPFFSFVYDGQQSAQFLGNWRSERAAKELDAHRTQHTLTYTDPKTGLAVRCVGVAWKDYSGLITNAAEELHFLRRYLEEEIKPDYWWQDAGPKTTRNGYTAARMAAC